MSNNQMRRIAARAGYEVWRRRDGTYDVVKAPAPFHRPVPVASAPTAPDAWAQAFQMAAATSAPAYLAAVAAAWE